MGLLAFALMSWVVGADMDGSDCDELSCSISMVQVGWSKLDQPRIDEGEQLELAELQRSSFVARRSARKSARAFSCLLLDKEVHRAVAQVLGPDAKADVEVAWSRLGRQNGCHPGVQKGVSWSRTFLKQKQSLLKLMGSLDHLSFQSLGHQSTNETMVFRFESVDATGKRGTGRLGQFSADESVSDVTIMVNQPGPFLWDLSPADMAFTIGPAIRNTFLIKGSLTPTKATSKGISGVMTAGFVNLRTTATGMWNTGPSGFTSDLTLQFGGFLDDKWTWQPA